MWKTEKLAEDQFQSDVIAGFDEVLEKLNKLIENLDRYVAKAKIGPAAEAGGGYISYGRLQLGTQCQKTATSGDLCRTDMKIYFHEYTSEEMRIDDVRSRLADASTDKASMKVINREDSSQFTETRGHAEIHHQATRLHKSALRHDVMASNVMTNGRPGSERASIQPCPDCSNTQPDHIIIKCLSTQDYFVDESSLESNSDKQTERKAIQTIDVQISENSGSFSANEAIKANRQEEITSPRSILTETDSEQSQLVRSSPAISGGAGAGRNVDSGEGVKVSQQQKQFHTKNGHKIISTAGLCVTRQESLSMNHAFKKKLRAMGPRPTLKPKEGKDGSWFRRSLKRNSFHKRLGLGISLDGEETPKQAQAYRRAQSLDEASASRIESHAALGPKKSLPLDESSSVWSPRSKRDQGRKSHTSRINRLWKTFRVSTNHSKAHCNSDVSDQDNSGSEKSALNARKKGASVEDSRSNSSSGVSDMSETSPISVSANLITQKGNRWSLDSSISDTTFRPFFNRERKSSSLVMPDKDSSSGGDDDKVPRRSTIGSSYTRELGPIKQQKKYPVMAERPDGLNRPPNTVISLALSRVANTGTEVKKRWSFRTRQPNLAMKQQIPENLETLQIAKSSLHKSKPSKLTESLSLDMEKYIDRLSKASGEGGLSKMYEQDEILDGTDLGSLCEPECDALQTLAQRTLQSYDLGVTITVPKDESRLLERKRKYGVHLPLTTRSKSKNQEDHVFAIPLVRVVENDQLLRLQTDEELSLHTGTEMASGPRGESGNHGVGLGQPDQPSPNCTPTDESFRSSPQENVATRQTSIDLTALNGQKVDGAYVPNENSGSHTPTNPDGDKSMQRVKSNKPVGRSLKRRDAIGADLNSEIDSYQTELLESLQSASGPKDKKRSLLPPTMPQVPYVVQKCCAHIVKYGLSTTGIFRIAGSKKRVRQLREEFDRGIDVTIDEDYNAHDVAALLKEFFRDLPEALLTRELYQAFLNTTKLCDRERRSALQCLVWLLPLPNRDTLQQLLSFLATVAEHSEDRIDEMGVEVPGNKMSVKNLSTIFGPNILHRVKKSSQSTPEVYSQVQNWAEESNMVIEVVNDMIRNHKDLFSITREVHHTMLTIVQETEPDVVNFLLRRKTANYMRQKSPVVRRRDVTNSTERDAENVHPKADATPPQGDPILSRNNNTNNNNGEVNRKKSEKKRKSWKRQKNGEKISDLPIVSIQKEEIRASPVSKVEEMPRRPERSSDTSSTGPLSPASFTGSFSGRSISFTESEMEEILLVQAGASPTAAKNPHTRHGSTGPATEQNPTPQRPTVLPSPTSSPRTNTNVKECNDVDVGLASGNSRRPGFSVNPHAPHNVSPACQDCATGQENSCHDKCHMDANMNWTHGRNHAKHSNFSEPKVVDHKDRQGSLRDRVNGDKKAYESKVREQEAIMRRQLGRQRSAPRHEAYHYGTEGENPNHMRKRLPSALNIRLPRMYGSDANLHTANAPSPNETVASPTHIDHFGRIHRLSDSETVDRLSATTDDDLSEQNRLRYVSSRGRRYSKDDMSLTIQRLNDNKQHSDVSLYDDRLRRLLALQEDRRPTLRGRAQSSKSKHVVTETLV